jgi:hypothetical protein
MGYNNDDYAAQKTGRIALLCGTMLILGFFTFLFRIEACKSTPETCKDEFFQLDPDSKYNNHSCSIGAVIETVSSPPAPKAGILCHCLPSKNGSTVPTPAPAASK